MSRKISTRLVLQASRLDYEFALHLPQLRQPRSIQLRQTWAKHLRYANPLTCAILSPAGYLTTIRSEKY